MTEFESWVWNDRVGDAVSQQATQAGDAAEDLPSDGVVVKAVRADGVLSLRKVESRVLTPNGDGVNDVVVFEVDLFLFTVKTAVNLEIYDLTGERIWSLQLALTAGSQRLIWSGRDVTGRPAMPGLYIYRIHVDSDAGARRIIGTVAVVY